MQNKPTTIPLQDICTRNTREYKRKRQNFIVILENNIEIIRGIESKYQEDGIILAGKEIGALDLIKYINKRTKHAENREVVIYIDNKRVITEYYVQIKKESKVTIEATGIITKIREEIKKVSIEIILELSKNKPKPGKLFHQQLGPVLMKNMI